MGKQANKHIILVSYYWPPAGGSGVQRWWFFANYLAKMGWTIDVITVNNPVGTPIESSGDSSLPQGIQLFPLSIWEPGKKLYQSATPTEKHSLFRTVVRWIRANFFFPDARQFFIKPAIRMVKKRLEKKVASWLITTGPPHATHMVGYAFRKNKQMRWMADFRDPWVQFFVNQELPMLPVTRKCHQIWEKRVVSAADCVLTTSPKLASIFGEHNANVHTVLNGFEKVLSGEPSKDFIITYAGALKTNQHLNLIRSVLEQLSSSNPTFSEKASLHLYGDHSTNNLPSSFTHQTVVHGYQSKKEIDQILPEAHILLLLGNDNPDSHLVIHGKIYEYMAARRPVLAVVNQHGDMSELIRKHNLGAVFLYSETDKIKKWIEGEFDRYVKGIPKELQAPSNLFSREKQAEELHLLLDKFEPTWG